MLRPLEGLPTTVVAFEAVGEVHADDYRNVLDPAVESAIAAHEKIRFLYVLGSEFQGFTGGAMWEDAKVGVGHWSRFERLALVTDDRAYHDAVRAFAWMLPGEVRLFTVAELAEAEAWIAA
ncbi:STAS/SEC14 domain-containing protein [Agromyces sp. NPDC058110]|uniref:STAS/SEC14 domain-containing protein n=1 Tax=Agromyces sp. NPDC058110 TaxID=3346345 RepID=UPI0036DDD414